MSFGEYVTWLFVLAIFGMNFMVVFRVVVSMSMIVFMFDRFEKDEDNRSTENKRE